MDFLAKIHLPTWPFILTPRGLILFLSLLFSQFALHKVMGWPSVWESAQAEDVGPGLPDAGIVTRDVDSFFDKSLDYSLFSGRVTDKDWTDHILKIETETQNVKFFRAGDPLTFRVNLHDKADPCEGYVQDHERQYLVIFVKNVKECWQDKGYFRRGTLLHFRSTRLMQRVVEASEYRKVLLQTRKDFLRQLGEINHVLWTYQQNKIKVAAEYDKKILEIKNQRQQALEGLLTKKEEKVILQKELMQKLDELDESLNFYQVERQEPLVDRWQMDQDLGLPVGKRPPALKKGRLDTPGAWYRE